MAYREATPEKQKELKRESSCPLGCSLIGGMGFGFGIGCLILSMLAKSVREEAVAKAKTQIWEDAVESGHAEKVIHSGGEGYRWKEK